MGKHNKRKDETQQLRAIPGDGKYVPMETEPLRFYVLRALAGLAAFAVVIALVIVICLLILR